MTGGAIQTRLHQGVDDFNEGLFFEAHDRLEDVWMDVRGHERLFFQGLIQLAIGYYHLSCGNYPGAEHLLGRCVGKLEQFRPSHRGILLDTLVETVRSTRTEILAGEDDELVWAAPVIERIDPG